MAFADLIMTKHKLSIPISNTSRDVAIQNVVDATNNWVMRQTGLSDEDEEVVDRRFDVQAGVPIYLSHRPVDEIHHVKARRIRGTNQDIPYDLIDDVRGMMVIDGYYGFGTNSLLDYTQNAWSSWRKGRWSVVEVSYRAKATDPLPEDLSDAASALAAYWYSRHLQNNVVMVGMGSIIERYSIDSVPVHISSILTGYIVEEPTWV
jgi:hypothetical protein